LYEEKIKINITKTQVKDWQDPKIILKLTKSFGSPGLESTKESALILQKNPKSYISGLRKKKLNSKAENY